MARCKEIEPLTEEEKQMVQDNLNLVYYFARMFPQIEFEEAVGQGYLGLCKAVQRYNAEKGKLSTYASYWILCYIRKLTQTGRPVKIPVNVQQKVHKLLDVKNEVINDGRKATAKNIAKATGFDEKEVEMLLGAYSNPVSLEKGMTDDGGTLENVLSYEDDVEILEMRKIINEKLELLTSNQKRVLQLRYGLLDGFQRTAAEVAVLLGKTKNWVYAVEKQALETLRKNADELKEYV